VKLTQDRDINCDYRIEDNEDIQIYMLVNIQY